jgi:hypothetical protein
MPKPIVAIVVDVILKEITLPDDDTHTLSVLVLWRKDKGVGLQYVDTNIAKHYQKLLAEGNEATYELN